MKPLKIGQVAKRAGVSVRTLHYYEEIGMLGPVDRTASGHRFYGRGAVERLQQIKGLQQLGFSLSEVNELLSGGGVVPARLVADQLERLRTKRVAIDRLEAQLVRLAERLESGFRDDTDAVDVFLKTIEEMTMYDKYLTTEQMKSVDAMHGAADNTAEAEWNDSLAGLRAEMEAGTDPGDPKVQALVGRWHQAAGAFMPADDASLHEGVMNALHSEPEALAAHGLDAELFAFIGRAAAPGDHEA